MRNAAVIGSSSMLGNAIRKLLQARGITTILIGRSSCDDIYLDLDCPPKTFSPDFNIDTCFHCASAFADNGWTGSWNNFRTNTLGCIAFLSLAEKLDCKKLVYSGSTWSYPNSEILDSFSSYGLSKAEGEKVLEWGMHRIGGSFCSLRFSQLYDSQGLCCEHQPWFGRIVAYASRGLDLQLPPSNGKRNFLHVEDAARMMIQAAELDIKGCWPACHKESLDYFQIANLAYNEFGRGGRVIIDERKQPFRKANYPDPQPLFAMSELMKPLISMKEGLSMINNNDFSANFGPLDVI